MVDVCRLLTRLLQVCFLQRMLQVGGKIPPSSISGSVPARDEIPVIFVRIFPPYPHQPCRTLRALVNSIWRTQTGSSYKLVTGREEKRYKHDVSGYDTVFGHARSTSTGTDVVRLRITTSGTNRK